MNYSFACGEPYFHFDEHNFSLYTLQGIHVIYVYLYAYVELTYIQYNTRISVPTLDCQRICPEIIRHTRTKNYTLQFDKRIYSLFKQHFFCLLLPALFDHYYIQYLSYNIIATWIESCMMSERFVTFSNFFS